MAAVDDFLKQNAPNPAVDKFLQENAPSPPTDPITAATDFMFGNLGNTPTTGIKRTIDNDEAGFSGRVLKAFGHGVEAANQPQESLMPPSVKEDMAKQKNLEPYGQSTEDFYKNWGSFMSDSAWDLLDKTVKSGQAIMAGVGTTAFDLSNELPTPVGDIAKFEMSRGDLPLREFEAPEPGQIPSAGSIAPLLKDHPKLSSALNLDFVPNVLGTNVDLPKAIREARANSLIGRASDVKTRDEFINTLDHDAIPKPVTPDENLNRLSEELDKVKTQPLDQQEVTQAVSDKVQAAGRPKEEADSAGQIWQAFWNTMSKRTNGKYGTPLQMYQRFGAEIQPGDLPNAEAIKGLNTYAQAQENAPTFFSSLSKTVETSKQEKASPDQWLSTIKNAQGVKKEELEWSGIEDWLKKQEGTVSKTDVQDYLNEHKVDIHEVTRAPNTPGLISRYGSDTQWGPLPGGKNYKELLLKLADRNTDRWDELDKKAQSSYGIGGGPDLTPEEQEEYDRLSKLQDNAFQSSHWPESNVLAHIRFDDRTGPNGERILHMAEIQSDWHQKGRREGYQGEAEGWEQGNDRYKVPNAPFKTSWHELAIKRMLRYAAENGYDKISWDTGDTAASRFDLNKQVDAIKAIRQSDGGFSVYYRPKDGSGTWSRLQNANLKNLGDHVGKTLADHIVKDLEDHSKEKPGQAFQKDYTGLDLKVGGEGMRGFYDKILPAFMNKYAKKWGSKVVDDKLDIPTDETRQGLNPDIFGKQESIHSLDITPDMKDSVLKGQPLFQKVKKIVTGALTTRASGKNLLRLFKTSDASSFIHESGHEFLEQLRWWGDQKQADPQLKADLKTVSDWLKVEDWDKLSKGRLTTAHEKFANTFTRYLQDGLAPSPELKSVFNRFAQWLINTINYALAIKHPVPDHIRDVFDRLLSTSPDRQPLGEPTEGVQSDIENQATDTGATADRTVRAPEGQTEGTTFAQKTIDPNKSINEQKDVKLTRSIAEIARPGGVQDLLVDIINRNKDFQGARGEKITDEDRINFAASQGELPVDVRIEGLHNMALGDIPTAWKVRAAAQATNEIAQHAWQALEDNNMQAYVEATQLLHLATEAFSTLQTDAGRTLYEFKKLYKEAETAGIPSEFYKNNIGKTFLQVQDEMKRMKELISKGATPAQALKQLKYERSASWGAYITEYLKCNWLTGPITHVTYEAANQIYTLERATLESFARGAVSAIQQARSPRPIERAYMWESVVGLHAYLDGQVQGLRSMGSSFRTGDTKGLTIPSLARQKADYEIANKIIPDNYRETRIQELTKNPTPDMHELAISPQNMFMSPKAIPGIAGSIARAGAERIVAPVHSWSYSVALQVHLNQLIARQALNEGLRGQAYINRFAQLKYEPPLRIIEEASKAAREQSLMTRQGDLAKRITGLTRWEPDIPGLGPTQPLAILEPFVGVKSNIIRLALRDNAVTGLAFKDVREDAFGKNGDIAQANAIGKIVAGTSIISSVLALRAFDSMTGPPPADKKARIVQMMHDGMPNSLRIGDHSIQTSRLGVLGEQAAFAGAMYDFIDNWKNENFGKASVNLMYAMGQEFVQNGVGGGFMDAFDATQDQVKGNLWIDRFLASAVPFAVGTGQISKLGGSFAPDPYMKEVHGWWETVQSNVPFAAENLENKIDLFGNRIPNKEYWGVYTTQVDNSPIMNMLANLNKTTGYFPGPVTNKIDGVQLNEQQLTAYKVYAGQALYQRLESLTQMENWNNLKVQTQLHLIKEAVSESRSAARNLLQAKDPTILQTRIENLKAIAQGH